MPQQPTEGALPAEVIREFKGLNDQADSVLRPKGTVTDMRNMYDEQAGDANRRAGRDFVSLDASGNPVYLIAQLSWDDGGVSIINQAGSTVGYDAITYSDNQNTVQQTIANPNTPGPMPNEPHFLPFIKNNPQVPDLTSLMRAISDARRYSGFADFSYRNTVWSFDAYDASGDGAPVLIKSNVNTKEEFTSLQSQGLKMRPTTGNVAKNPGTDGRLIPNNFYWPDYVANPALIVSDLNDIITNVNIAAQKYVFTNPIEGASSIANWSAGTFETTFVTQATYKVIWEQLAARINTRLLQIQVAASVVQLTVKRCDSAIVPGAASILAAISCAETRIANQSSNTLIQVRMGICSINSTTASSPTTGALANKIGALTSTIDVLGDYGVDYTVQPGKLSANLTAYTQGSAEIFLKLGAGFFTFGSGLNRPTIAAQDVYGKWESETVTLGATYTSGFVTSDSDLNFSTILVNNIQWQVDGAVIIITRTPEYFAYGPAAPAMYFPIVSPDEYFSIQSAQTVTTSPTDISWGTVKLTGSGAGNRSLYSETTTGNPVNFTPSSTISFSSQTPGFERSRFKQAYYRPVILGILSLQTLITSGTPTSLTVGMYINGNLVRTTTGVPLGFAKLYYGFSILDVGEFSDIRPPDNDANNDLDGWAGPLFKITATANSGTVTIQTATKLTDYVLNYAV